jgi:hypothetical protein
MLPRHFFLSGKLAGKEIKIIQPNKLKLNLSVELNRLCNLALPGFRSITDQ